MLVKIKLILSTVFFNLRKTVEFVSATNRSCKNKRSVHDVGD
jgi:hypothetical protein